VDAARREVASQPELWRDAARLAKDIDVSLTLPDAGERVAVVGHRACLRMARAYALLRTARGLGETHAFEPGDVTEDPTTFDRFVFLSGSGEGEETVEAIRFNQEIAVVTTAMTASAGSRVAELSGHTILLEGAHERSGLPTRFASTALALLRAHLGDDLSPVIEDARRAIRRRASKVERVASASDGWSAPIAEEISWWLTEVGGTPTGETRAMERDPMVELVAAQMSALRARSHARRSGG
jgi:fructoselysine-6-P-deglycase FrlB-like protein